MKRIVVISDLHIGHRRALTPKEYFSNALTNDFQRWVLGSWDDFVQRYRDPDILILNGDLADGSQVKSLGVEAISTSLDTQEEMAVGLLRELISKEKTEIYGINGSGYHGGMGQGTCMDKRITEALGGKFKGKTFTLPIGKELIQFAHGSGGGVTCPDTYIRREVQLAQKTAGKRGSRLPSLLIRSHGHLYQTIGDAATVAYMTPCWEYPTEFMQSKTVNFLPDIGGLIIEIEEDTKIFPRLYPMPDELIQSMDGWIANVIPEEKTKIEKKAYKDKIKLLKGKKEV